MKIAQRFSVLMLVSSLIPAFAGDEKKFRIELEFSPVWQTRNDARIPNSTGTEFALRDILLMKRRHIDYDMQSREVQWSRLREPAPCLNRESFAYRFAGFGTHEIVLYYELVRMLISDCWMRMRREISIPDEIARLERVQAEWLNTPAPEYGGNTPSCLMEYERLRLPWLLSEEDIPFYDDCPLCRALAREKPAPGFWHLDGCNMDRDFAFSFCRTREEWQQEACGLEESALQAVGQEDESGCDTVH